MKLYAPAKINWTLEVLGRREDGYHEVRTLMQTVSLCDELEIESAEGLSLESDGRHAAPVDDLVLKAARLLQWSGLGARLRLTKRIPDAAGLGGGSSDAAATLRGLNQLWGLGLDAAALAEVAAQVGSDVAFFLQGGTALSEGRGERVTPLADVQERWLVLLVPPIEVAGKTAAMYAALQPGDFSDGSRTAAALRRRQTGEGIAEEMLCNAFERAAYEILPQLPEYAACLSQAAGSPAHLAGSGPALFALAAGPAEAEAACQRLASRDGACFALRTLNRVEALGHGE
ncbi:MAG TPA: 4-(cytidine 5'-diphospho)-2-C-methyl-D-erythritol kinase [Dehalococcoidia bacterium]|nr:4-(cytidine 5'-diphospho)-2-C-methyl-D-erythritol kinase [Dehalococcoidia bacterium]